MKAYTSYEWMRRRFLVDHWTEEKIANYCKVNQATISRWLHKHGLKK
jgi:arginine repressor